MWIYILAQCRRSCVRGAGGSWLLTPWNWFVVIDMVQKQRAMGEEKESVSAPVCCSCVGHLRHDGRESGEEEWWKSSDKRLMDDDHQGFGSSAAADGRRLGLPTPITFLTLPPLRLRTTWSRWSVG
jgi:hypothetical protein